MQDSSLLEVWGSRFVSIVLAVLLLGVLVVGVGPLILPYKTFTVYSASMAPSIPLGAEIFDVRVAAETIKSGDIITFTDPTNPSRLVTHRVVRLEAAGARTVAITQGDANGAPDTWKVPLEGRGLKVFFWLPFVGYALNALQAPLTRVLFLVLIALLGFLTIRSLLQGDPEPDW